MDWCGEFFELEKLLTIKNFPIMFISKNQNFKEEYCASVVRIGETFPIEGKDRIVKTLVNGNSIVIGKDEFKTGDIAVYCASETVLHELFLHLNSMYDEKELNADQEKRGYINKHGRLRVIRLGGVPSYGLLLHPASIATFINEPVEDVVKFLESHEGEDFDEINGERFVQVYVPPIKGQQERGSKAERLKKKLDRFKMLIEGSFRLHYETAQLQKNMRDINPDDEVYISVKVHGTSAIFANILTNVPTNWFKRMWRKYITHTPEYDQKYNLVYSSRTVVKNEYINKKQKPGGFYSDDVWGYWAKKLDGLVPKDYCIYCEIAGFTPNGSPIQKGYDYGCTHVAEEKSKLMVYRATKEGKELEISDVIMIGAELKKKLGDCIMVFPLLYQGTLKDLYPEVSTTEHWHENVLEKLKVEKKFKMEEDEPLCRTKVPREGFVLRKANDPVSEAWKLKTDAFKFREAKLVDAGEVDIEMQEGYCVEDVPGHYNQGGYQGPNQHSI